MSSASPSFSSTTTSPSPSPHHHHSAISDDEKTPPPPSFPSDPPPPPPPTTRTPVFPSREDCWSEDATRTLIDAWGSHYLDLNRGNLRQNHWQAVADAVNAVHATTAKLHRTDVQCKNRLDTVKKKYKIEKSKVVESDGRYVSPWPHFQSLDSLIGGSFSKSVTNHSANRKSRNLRRRVSRSPESSPSPPTPLTAEAAAAALDFKNSHYRGKDASISPLPRVPWSIPVGPRSKRSGLGMVTKRNFSVMAAAAAALEAQENDDIDDYDDGVDSGEWGGRLLCSVGRKRKQPVEDEDKLVLGEGYRSLAEAITKFGKIYEKVEAAKQKQIVELEKQRMQFAKDLEIQRMKVFMESQVQLEKLKRAKHNIEKCSYS